MRFLPSSNFVFECNEPNLIGPSLKKMKLWRLPKIEGSILKYRVGPCPLAPSNKKLAWNVDCPPSKWKTKL
jgi:hypothetical protein